MPELPEVETVVRGLRNTVVGDVIEDVWLSGRRQPLKSPPEEIAAVLEGARIAGVRRMGKHIVIDLDVARAPSPRGIVANQPQPRAAAPHVRTLSCTSA